MVSQNNENLTLSQSQITNSTVNSDTRSNLTKSQVFSDAFPKTAVLADHITNQSGFSADRFFDWFTFVGRKVSGDKLVEFMDKVMTGELWGKHDKVTVDTWDSEFSFYKGSLKLDKGCKNDLGIVCYLRELEGKDEGYYEVMVMFSGIALSQIFSRNDIVSPLKLCKAMKAWGFHPTRVDGSISFCDVEFIPNMYKALFEGNYTGFKNASAVISFGEVEERKLDNIDKIKQFLASEEREKDLVMYGMVGGTLYLGSRQSTEMTRVYYEYTKHGEPRTRFEKEFKGKKARKVIDNLLDIAIDSDWDNTKLLKAFDEIIKGKHRFIDRSLVKECNGSLEDCPELPFWEKFTQETLSFFPNIDMRIERPKSNWRTKVKWAFRQLKSTLRNLYFGLPKDLVDKVLELMVKCDMVKFKPDCVKKEQVFQIEILRKKGIYALFSEDEMQLIHDEYGIDFGSQTSYYEPKVKEDSLVANKRVLRGLLKTSDNITQEQRERLQDELSNHTVRSWATKIDNNIDSIMEGYYDLLDYLVSNGASCKDVLMYLTA